MIINSKIICLNCNEEMNFFNRIRKKDIYIEKYGCKYCGNSIEIRREYYVRPSIPEGWLKKDE